MLYAENLGEKSMDKDDILKRIKNEEDYIRCPKCSNSLSKFLAKNSDGVEDNVIARVLMITEEEVQKIYAKAVEQLQKDMVKDDE